MLQDRTLFDFIISLHACSSAADSFALYNRTLNSLGITESFYSLAFGVEDRIAVANYRESFLEAYEEAGGAVADFTVSWSLYQTQPLIWNNPRYIPELTAANFRVEQVSADFNIQQGFTLPIRTDISYYWGGVGLSATGVKAREFERDILPRLELIQALTAVFDMKVRQFSGDHNLLVSSDTLGSLRALNPVERETLKWLAEGYSIKQIADEKLYRSVDSINLYIRGAKQKLKARNRDQLIARALILKLIP